MTSAGCLTRLGPQLDTHVKLQQAMDVAMQIQYNLLPQAAPNLSGLDVRGMAFYCDAQWSHKILTQNFTRSYRIEKFVCSRNYTSMIIDNFNIKCITTMPSKADAPLLIE